MNSKKLISSPSKNSSMSKFSALPNLPLKISLTAISASSFLLQIYTPLPDAKLSAFITIGYVDFSKNFKESILF